MPEPGFSDRGFNRRQILALPLVATATHIPRAYRINEQLSLRTESDVKEIKEVSELGRELLIAGNTQISGVYSSNNPFGPPEEITRPTKYAAERIITNLQLADTYSFEEKLRTYNPEQDIVFLGGPVPNPYSRLILGAGYGSEILRLSGASDGFLPFMFDLITPLKEKRFRPYTQGSGKRPDWDLIVDGSRRQDPGDYLLITCIPNVYSKKGRLVVVAGKGGPGTRAIDLVLRNPFLIATLLAVVKDYEGWQILIPVLWHENEIPRALGTAETHPIKADFDKARAFLAGTPLLAIQDSKIHVNFSDFF